MIDGKFDIVFRGQTIRNKELSEVKANLATLFKSSAQAVEKLFTGDEVVVKRSLDYPTAMKYQSALKKAGALALIKEIEAAEPVITSKSDGKAVFGQPDTSPPEASNLTKQPQAESIKPIAASPANSSATDSISSQSAQQGSLSGQVTLAEVGSQLMPDKVYEKREVDTSELSLAGVGERIMPPKPAENHPVPSIDHLSIEN